MCSNRGLAVTLYGHICYEPVASGGNRLDITCHFDIVPKGLAQLADDPRQDVLGDEGIPPNLVDKLLFLD